MWLLLPFLLVAFGVFHDSAVLADICPIFMVTRWMPGELNSPQRSYFFLQLDPNIPPKNPFDATKRPNKNTRLKITEHQKFIIGRVTSPSDLFRVVDLCLRVKKAVTVKAKYAIFLGMLSVIREEVRFIPSSERKKYKEICFKLPVPHGIGNFGQKDVSRIWISFTTTNAWWDKIQVKKMFMKACLDRPIKT